MDEDKNQRLKNFKWDESKKGRHQKRKENHDKSSGGDWKSHFRKATKIDNGLKLIISTLAVEK